MNLAVRLLVLMLLSVLLPADSTARSPSAPAQAAALTEASLGELEQRLTEFDTELEQLARFKIIGGLGPVGFESQAHRNPQHTEWVQVEWEEPTPIDEVVLVPRIWHDSKVGFTASGFPLEFQIIAGAATGSEGRVLASFSAEDQLLPRKAPLIVPCSVTASWVRVQASVLSQRGVDEQFTLQLAELLVFSGEDNIALMSEVTASSVGRQEGFRRNKAYLTDGFMPYEMDAGSEKTIAALVWTQQPGDQPVITIDLGKIYPINRIHLHGFNTGVEAPQTLPNIFGLPDRFIIEGANREDFSDAVSLIQHQKNSIYDTSPIFMRRFPQSPHRFVRLTALDLNKLADLPEMMSLAEIEIFADGRNVALGRPVQVAQSEHKDKQAMTDGHNAYGRILPVRQWVDELARRHDLELLRPILRAEIDRRYARQKDVLRTMSWLSALLAAGIVIAILIDRLIYTNQIKKLRERVAADLHDELGANLYAIRMLGQLAKDSVDSKEELLDTLDEISGLVERSGRATRNCIDRASIQGIDLPEDMRRAARRLGRDLNVALKLENEERLAQLPPPMQYNLFLFYRECLVNISRHAEATRVDVHLRADAKTVRLTVRDNGSGISGGVPDSLRRRARLLRGRVDLEPYKGSGACINLTLKRPGRFSPVRLHRSTS